MIIAKLVVLLCDSCSYIWVFSIARLLSADIEGEEELWSVRAGYNARSQRGDLESVKDLIDPFYEQQHPPLHYSVPLSLSCCCRAETGVSSQQSGDSHPTQQMAVRDRGRGLNAAHSVSDSLSHNFTSHWASFTNSVFAQTCA